MLRLLLALLLIPSLCLAQDIETVEEPLLYLDAGPGFFTSLEDTLQRTGVDTYVGASINLGPQVAVGLRLDLMQESERQVASTLWGNVRGYLSSNEGTGRVYLQLGLGTDFDTIKAGVRGGYEMPLSKYLKAFLEVEGRWLNEDEIDTMLMVPVGIRASFGHRS